MFSVCKNFSFDIREIYFSTRNIQVKRAIEHRARNDKYPDEHVKCF
jgi:hypothetical protein